MDADLLTYDEAAQILGVEKDTLQRWAAERRIEVIRFSHTCVRIQKTELKRFITRHIIKPLEN